MDVKVKLNKTKLWLIVLCFSVVSFTSCEEKKQELKELKEVLSQELADYYRQEGTMEIEDHTGNIKRMKFNVSLIS